MGLTLWDELGLNGERGEGLPAHMEALSRVHMHLLSASCVPGPVAGAKSKGLTETRLLRGVKGAASRISLFLDSRLQKKCLIRGPTAGMSRAQTPTGARGPCCSRVRLGANHTAVTAELCRLHTEGQASCSHRG